MSFLKKRTNQIVDIIAPGSKKDSGSLKASEKLLESWGYIPRAPDDIFGPDILYSNNDENRLRFLIKALEAADSRFIWALRGGCGSTRLLPGLEAGLSPLPEKIFAGFSDITALHIFLYQNWGWNTCIHGPTLRQIAENAVDALSIQMMRQFLEGKDPAIAIELHPLNKHTDSIIKGPLCGGNLSLIQSSIGTSWQLNAKEHILVLEDVDEKPYRTAERLEHMNQAGIFRHTRAIVFGDFNFHEKVDQIHKDIYPEVLRKFAALQDFAVFQAHGIGHGYRNIPFRIGRMTSIQKINELCWKMEPA